MENKPSKKLVKSAAVLSLTAVLAAMPVSAQDYYVYAGSSSAEASVNGYSNPSVMVELSCEYGSTYKSDSKTTAPGQVASVAVSISADEADYHDGALMGTYAAAWSEGELLDDDYGIA